MLKKIFIPVFFTLSLFGLLSCDEQGKEETAFKEKKNGLKYRLVTDKEGKTVEIGNVVIIDYKYIYEDEDTLIKEEINHSTRVSEPDFKGNVDDALTMMSVGDSAIFKISTDSFPMSRLPAFIDTGSYLTYHIKLHKIYKNDSAYREAKKKQLEKEINVEEKEKKEEITKIKDYLKKKELNYNKTSSGLFYKIHKEGNGKKVKNGNYVKFHYKGRLLNGKEFQSTYKKDEPYEFMVGAGHIIDAWDEGFQLLKEGAKATFIAPPYLAFGKHAQGAAIPKNSTVIFEVELLKVSKQKP